MINTFNDQKKYSQKFGKYRNLEQLMPRIAIIGVGGAGTNSISSLYKIIGKKVSGVKFFVCNTDVQSLMSAFDYQDSKALDNDAIDNNDYPNIRNNFNQHNNLNYENNNTEIIILGENITKGKGAGGDPEIGKAAAQDSIEEIKTLIGKDFDMAIITAGMGGGTGTGATPEVVKALRASGVLTIGVVSKPFAYEGVERMKTATNGIKILKESIDTLIVTSNNKLSNLADGVLSYKKTLELDDLFLYEIVINMVNMIRENGRINIDFADISSVIRGRHSIGMIGYGYAEGEGCGQKAMKEATESLYLDIDENEDISEIGVDWSSVENIIVYITAGENMTNTDLSEACNYIKSRISPNAKIKISTMTKEDITGIKIFILGTTGNKISKSIKYETSLNSEFYTKQRVNEDEAKFTEKDSNSFLRFFRGDKK